MKLNKWVVSLAVLSLTTAAFAGNVAQKANCDSQALQAALNGNSYAGFVPHNFVKGVDGLWIAGFGQMTAAYNSTALISQGGSPSSLTNNGSFTVGLPHAMVLMGYQSNHVGMFVNANYANTPYATATRIQLQSRKTIPEAYLTYKINDMFALKGGKFNADTGSYDPTAALMSVGSSIARQNVTGIEAVVATNGFHGSVAGAMVNGATKAATTGSTNDARPNAFIVNAGYDMPFRGGTASVEGSYNSKLAVPGTATTTATPGAWTLNAHFANDNFVAKAGILNIRSKSGTKPYVFDGYVDYKLGNRFGHGMILGAYGSYLNKTTNQEAPIHWLLGAKFGYTLNSYANAVVYAQHAKAYNYFPAFKDNNTLMLALTVKV